MKIPKKVDILGFEWPIIDNGDVSHHSQVYGLTQYKGQKIFLEPEPDCTKQKREQVMLHEIMHVLWWQMGLAKRYEDTPKIEEEIVTTLSQGLWLILKENKLHFDDIQ